MANRENIVNFVIYSKLQRANGLKFPEYIKYTTANHRHCSYSCSWGIWATAFKASNWKEYLMTLQSQSRQNLPFCPWVICTIVSRYSPNSLPIAEHHRVPDVWGVLLHVPRSVRGGQDDLYHPTYTQDPASDGHHHPLRVWGLHQRYPGYVYWVLGYVLCTLRQCLQLYS